MVLGIDESEVIKIAVEHAGTIINGYAVYDCMEDGEQNRLFGRCLFNNEFVHPEDDKYCIELFKVNQNQDFDMACYDCDIPENEKESCCKDAWIEENIEKFDDNNREVIEFRIREIISDIVSEDLDKLNKIRLGISAKLDSPIHYQEEIFNTDYEMNILDELVDNAYYNGLYAGYEPKEFLEPFVEQLGAKFDFIHDYPQNNNLNDEDIKLCIELRDNLYDYKLDETLKLLKK